MASDHIPTVNDLRVKLCYICREEEQFDKPEDPPRAWTHPCSCTLVAHESCLLQWIQTSQQNPSRAANALKCPQCGTTYKLESNNPLVLRLLDAGNRSLSFVGRIVTVCSLGAIVASFGTGIYIISTAYGAYALKEFLGKEMYDLILTDDPSNWPWHAFLNLPLIPIGLILSRFDVSSSVFPSFPLLLAWPSSAPISSRQRLILDHWSNTDNAAAASIVIHTPRLLTWPPSPALCGILLFPFARSLYRKWFSRFSRWVLDTQPTVRRPARRFVWDLNDNGALRVVVNQNRAENGDQNQNPNRNRDQAAFQQQADQQALQQQGNAPAQAQDPAAAAEHTIRVTGASMGRIIGGALVMPAVSNLMGSLLFRFSKRFPLLRGFLAVRPPLNGIPLSPLGVYSLPENWRSMSALRQIGFASRLALTALWSGTATWMECDPVWWRNTIGLGIFIAAKDCLQLLHLWLAKRELESRKVMNQSFEGVDVRELDLIQSPLAV